jgi:hypothetical protein
VADYVPPNQWGSRKLARQHGAIDKGVCRHAPAAQRRSRHEVQNSIPILHRLETDKETEWRARNVDYSIFAMGTLDGRSHKPTKRMHPVARNVNAVAGSQVVLEEWSWTSVRAHIDKMAERPT